jgi:hypothetical protein
MSSLIADQKQGIEIILAAFMDQNAVVLRNKFEIPYAAR